MTYDLIITNARIIDGAGNPWFLGAVAVAEGRIAAIGRHGSGENGIGYNGVWTSGITAQTKVIDAGGRYVCPGFVDTHTHSDFSFFIDPTAQSKVRQGVTTEITGNCGSSAAPWMDAGRRTEAASGFEPTWTTMAEYLEALDDVGQTLNIAPLVGHGTLRGAVIGREDRPGTEDELAEMERLLRESLRAGAVGMSMGLYFAPGMYAPREELVRLMRIVADEGKLTAAHIRDEGTYTVGFRAAVEEFIGLGEESRCPVHISHLKAHGPEVWGISTQILELISHARARGVQVTADQYPWDASGGGLIPDTLPHSFQAGRSPEEISRDLQDSQVRAELHDAVAAAIERRGGADRLFMSTYPDEAVLGRTIADLALDYGFDAADMVMDLLARSGGGRASWTCFSMDSEDVERFMRYPTVMVGSDGSSLSTEGPLSSGTPHPRNYATFPRVLGHYVRDRGVLGLVDAVRKMTSLPAQTFGLSERGLLAIGYHADLVLFDLAQITFATYLTPKRYPTGIDDVMVGGQWVIRDSEFTGALPGAALRG
jgi:N-acyl-D-amino-acid deacylase